MEKHITLVGILNIVYRAWTSLAGVILLLIGISFEPIMYHLRREHLVHLHDVPEFVFDLAPVILSGIGGLILVFSALGIAAGIGVLQRREWGRILLLIVSFFTLLRVPLGTLLGGYSLWVLMKDETVRIFNPASVEPAKHT